MERSRDLTVVRIKKKCTYCAIKFNPFERLSDTSSQSGHLPITPIIIDLRDWLAYDANFPQMKHIRRHSPSDLPLF